MEDLTLNIILELLIAQEVAGMGLVNTGKQPMSLRRRNLKTGCCMWSQSLHPDSTDYFLTFRKTLHLKVKSNFIWMESKKFFLIIRNV